VETNARLLIEVREREREVSFK